MVQFEICSNGETIIDSIIEEADKTDEEIAKVVKNLLLNELKEKMKQKTDTLLENRYKKFRNIGKYSE